jgi:hypothetical protein
MNVPAIHWRGLLIADRFLFSVIRLAYGMVDGSVPFAGREE